MMLIVDISGNSDESEAANALADYLDQALAEDNVRLWSIILYNSPCSLGMAKLNLRIMMRMMRMTKMTMTIVMTMTSHRTTRPHKRSFVSIQ
jgi:hypothetical protein